MNILKYLSAGALLALLPATVYAQSIPPELAKELEKKFSKRVLTTLDHMATDIKKDNIGPYVFEDYFNLANASPLGGAAKRVRKYCEKEQEGTFNQTALILPEYKLSTDPISIVDKGQTLSVSAEELYFMARTKSFWPRSHALKYEKLSREKKLGVFNCKDTAGSILWSVAIIPDTYYKTKTGLAGEPLYKKQISVVPLDAETITAHKKALVSLRSKKAADEQEANNAAAMVKSKANNFQATADVGMVTNCGMIIQNRRPIFEIDLKSSVARRSGKSTAWVKADDLRPEDSPEACTVK